MFAGLINNVSWPVALAALPAAGLLYVIGLCIYRLTLDPLAKYPGPKIAAVTLLYEYYYETICNFDYLMVIKKMHQKYGPIVRISPREIHIDDPEYFDQLNSFRGKWNKDEATALQFGNPHATFGTVDHDMHKRRREAVTPFFAKQKIYQLEHVIQAMVDKLTNRMSDFAKQGQIVPMRFAFKALSADTAAEYCFARNGNMMDADNFGYEYFVGVKAGLDAGLHGRYLPKWVIPAAGKAPAWISKSIDPGAKHFEVWHRDVEVNVDNVHTNKDEDVQSTSGHRTIFHDILNSTSLGPEEKTRSRIAQEGAAIIGGSGETLSQVLALMVYGIISQPHVHAKVREELKTIQSGPSDTPSLKALESLPYLKGCVLEACRLRTGSIARHQRVPMGKSIWYKNYEIKPGTICSMTPMFVHLDEDKFPDPFAFKPERWADLTEKERIKLERYMVAFSKGTRMCFGMTLALALLYMAVPAVLTRFDLEMHETSPWDIEIAIDWEKHAPLKFSKGLQVKCNDSTF